MHIRIAVESDLPELADLFTGTVQNLAPQYYTPEQVAAWAASPADPEKFRDFILQPTTFVAEMDRIVGFAGVTETGYVASLFVHADFQRQGVGSQLLTQIFLYAEQHSIDRLYTAASAFSRPLFEKFGFTVYERERVARNGVWFERDLMQRFSSVS